MSLDVTILLKHPKTLNYWDTHAACGSTVAMVDNDFEEEVDHIHLNITHNMGIMASHVPVTYTNPSSGEWYETTLYQMVWRPDEIGDGHFCCNTSVMAEALGCGIAYMVTHRDELLQYNPDNGWGSYDAFLSWLITYKRNCDENPDCEIVIWR